MSAMEARDLAEAIVHARIDAGLEPLSKAKNTRSNLGLTPAMALATKLIERLEKNGYGVWEDSDLDGG